MTEIACTGSWEIDGEILDWAGLCDVWVDYGLNECCDFMLDLANKCDHLCICSETNWGGGPLADTCYTATSDNPEATKQSMRDELAKLIRKNMDHVRRYRRTVRDLEAGNGHYGLTEPERKEIEAIVEEVVRRLDRPRKKGDPLDGLWVNPWAHRGGWTQPESAQPLCSWELFVEVDHFTEELYFCRTDKRDSLWIHLDFQSGTAVSRPRQGEPRQAALYLLTVLGLLRAGFGWPDTLKGSRLLSDQELHYLFGKIERELDARRLVEEG